MLGLYRGIAESWILFDEQDLLLPQQQKFMLFYLHVFGIFGLRDALTAIARQNAYAEIQDPGKRLDQLTRKRKRPSSHRIIVIESDGELSVEEDEVASKPHASWQILLDDAGRKPEKSLVLFYLASIPKESLLGMIRGDLPKCLKEAEVEARRYCIPRNSPGSYVIFVARSETEADPGSGLSLYEFWEVLSKIRLYIDTGHSQSAAWAKEVDMMYGDYPVELSHLTQRRYASGRHHDRFEAIEFWLKQWDKIFHQVEAWVKDASRQHYLNRPMRRCLGYAGLSSKCEGRCNQHLSHFGNESIVYGLYTATLKRLYGTRFTATHHAYQVIHTVHEDHMCMSELTTTVLGGFLLTEGGLNRTYSGVSPGAPVSNLDAQAIRLTENAQRIANAPFQERNLKDTSERVKRFRDLSQPALTQAALPTDKEQILTSRQAATGDGEGKLIGLRRQHNTLKTQIGLLRAVEERDQIEAALKVLEGL
ncbi:hypothetical protein LTR70_006886 [Exophiala xenobiotica]|uniref:Uncharacterized protein n=1 Tax=Lithohypha guttulata TaxID=1690604 RepID=A0ABR0K6F0_9EURO|nr:hypothetical protein LTR24_006380 [Lithohypha guttulata]KAK5315147.1 hypothetical protein LTR70_006886 [Exophiala xenobiotica]